MTSASTRPRRLSSADRVVARSCSAPAKASRKAWSRGKNCGRANDLAIALVDQFLEDLTAGTEAGVNLRERVATVGLPDDEVGRALQQGQKRNERKKAGSNCGIGASGITSIR